MQAEIRIGCLQFDPSPKDAVSNSCKVSQLIEDAGLRKGDVDLLVLPEMALTGYVFQDEADINPFVESIDTHVTGPSFHLARKLALQLGSYILIGFPEDGRVQCRLTATNANLPPTSSDAFDARSAELVAAAANEAGSSMTHFNSALLVDRRGNCVHTFRKHFLYELDKRWAQEGPGFQYVDLPDLGRLAVGICMDLNPYEFKADFEVSELGNFALANSIDILAIPMNWLMPQDEKEANQIRAERNRTAGNEAGASLLPTPAPSQSTISYWLMRLAPLFLAPTAAAPKKIAVAFANRSGTEQDTTFAGSSCVCEWQIGGTIQEPIRALGQIWEGVVLRTIRRDVPVKQPE